MVKLLSGRLEGKTVDSVRTKLPSEQLGRAIEKVGKQARPIPDLLRSPAYAAADQQKYLTALQQFYKAEAAALQSLYEERSRLNKK